MPLIETGARPDYAIEDALDERVCVVCGCTEAEACPGGCAWVSDDANLCTACLVGGEGGR